MPVGLGKLVRFANTDEGGLEELRTQIQQELERRNNKSVIIIADCADNLFQDQYFDQSELVESR
jgi:hypothetical protein